MGDSLSDDGKQYGMYYKMRWLPGWLRNRFLVKSPHNAFTNGYVWAKKVKEWVKSVIPAWEAPAFIDLAQGGASAYDYRHHTVKALLGQTWCRGWRRFLKPLAGPCATLWCWLKHTVLAWIVSSLQEEIEHYCQHDKVTGSELFIILIGANDILLFDQRGEAGAERMISGVRAGVAQLTREGARQFLFITLPDISKTPQFAHLSEAERLAVRNTVNQFNKKLKRLAAAIRSEDTWTNAQSACSSKGCEHRPARMSAEAAKADRPAFLGSPFGIRSDVYDLHAYYERVCDHPEAYGFTAGCALFLMSCASVACVRKQLEGLIQRNKLSTGVVLVKGVGAHEKPQYSAYFIKKGAPVKRPDNGGALCTPMLLNELGPRSARKGKLPMPKSEIGARIERLFENLALGEDKEIVSTKAYHINRATRYVITEAIEKARTIPGLENLQLIDLTQWDDKHPEANRVASWDGLHPIGLLHKKIGAALLKNIQHRYAFEKSSLPTDDSAVAACSLDPCTEQAIGERPDGLYKGWHKDHRCSIALPAVPRNGFFNLCAASCILDEAASPQVPSRARP